MFISALGGSWTYGAASAALKGLEVDKAKEAYCQPPNYDAEYCPSGR